jgi:hypothetical protein
MKKVTMVIDVVHECSEGWHELTSPQIPGLYIVVEQDDLEAAFHDVPAAIEMLIEADTGRRVKVVQLESYDEYVEKLPPAYRPASIRHYTVQQAA